MSLNVGFSGKIYDETNQLIDANIYGYSVTQKVWSSAYTSQYNTYACNLGDGCWLSQTGIATIGDKILLKFKSLDNTRIGFFETILTKSVLYIENVQIIPISNPSLNISLPSTAKLNQNIKVTVDANDDHTWKFNNITFYQKDVLYNTNVFKEELGIVKTEFDWGNGYTEINSFAYTDIGIHTVSVRVTNKAGLQTIKTAQVQVLYGAPVGGMDFSNNAPYKNDLVDISATIQDTGNTITSIEYYFDDTLVEINQNISFIYSKLINVIKQITVTQLIHWNDGFSDQVVQYQEILKVSNHPPTCSFVYSNEGMTYRFDPTYADIDGTVIGLEWVLEYELPFVNVYNKIVDTGFLEPDSYYINLPTGGKYRVTLTAKDDLGAIGTFTDNFTAMCENTTGNLTSSSECVFLNEKYYYSTFAYSNNMNSKFDITTGTWSNDISYTTRASDIMQAVSYKYNITYGDYINSEDITRYIRYVQTYDTKTGKFLVYSPGITPIDDVNNFHLIIIDEKGNLLSRGIQILMIQPLETIHNNIKGITVPFSNDGMTR